MISRTWRGLANEATRAVMRETAPGSLLVISHASSDQATPAEIKTITGIYDKALTPIYLRTRDEITAFFDGLQLAEPGVTDINQRMEEARLQANADDRVRRGSRKTPKVCSSSNFRTGCSRPPRQPSPVRDTRDEAQDGEDDALLIAARRAAAEHQAQYGQPITRDALRARLGVSNQAASELLRQLRAAEGRPPGAGRAA